MLNNLTVYLKAYIYNRKYDDQVHSSITQNTLYMVYKVHLINIHFIFMTRSAEYNLWKKINKTTKTINEKIFTTYRFQCVK